MDSLFDNIYIGHSIEDATKLKAETFDVKHGVEIAQEAIDQAKEAAEAPKITPTPSGIKFTEDPVEFVKEKVNIFVTVAKTDPLEAIKLVPEVAGGIGVLVVTLLAILLGGIGAGAKSPKVQETAQKAKDKAMEAKDQVAEGVSTGAEKAQAEINKRTTRSSAAADQ